MFLRPRAAFASAILAIAVAGLSGLAQADSLTDSLGPREMGVGDSKRAEAVGSMATVLNPAGLSLDSQLTFEGYYGFRPQDSMHVGAVSACDSTTPVAGCFYYHYGSSTLSDMDTGDDGPSRRFHEGGIAAARPLSEHIVFGTNVRYFDYNSDLVGESDESGIAFDAGLIVRATPALRLAAVGYNLFSTGTEQYPRALATGISTRPGSGRFSITADALWNLDAEDKGGRYGGGLEVFVGGGGDGVGIPLRGGALYDAARESAYASFGLGLASAGVGLDIGSRIQVSGEGEREIIVVGGLRILGPSVAQQ